MANPSGCGLEHLDVALGPGSSCEFLIAGEQSDTHGLGECYVGGVVDGEVVAQLPAAGEQRAVRCPSGRKCSQIIEGEAGPPGIEGACSYLPSQHGCDLQVGEFGDGEPLAM